MRVAAVIMCLRTLHDVLTIDGSNRFLWNALEGSLNQRCKSIEFAAQVSHIVIDGGLAQNYPKLAATLPARVENSADRDFLARGFLNTQDFDALDALTDEELRRDGIFRRIDHETRSDQTTRAIASD